MKPIHNCPHCRCVKQVRRLTPEEYHAKALRELESGVCEDCEHSVEKHFTDTFGRGCWGVITLAVDPVNTSGLNVSGRFAIGLHVHDHG